VDLDTGYFGSLVVEIGLEGDDTGLVGLDELRHLPKASLEIVQSSLLDPALADEDEWPGHVSLLPLAWRTGSA
jgi:hypothetical protein